MNLFEEMRTFIAVADTGSFSAAARRLGLAKSIVSRRVSTLEHYLQCSLLSRTTRQLSLTEVGQNYYQRAHLILQDVAEAEEMARGLQHEMRGRLRISMPVSFGVLRLASLINAFMLEHPNLEVEMGLDDNYIDLVSSGFDVGIRIGSLDDPALLVREIMPCVHKVCASPDYLRRHGTPLKPDDLRRHVCLSYTNRSQTSQWQFQMDGRWNSIPIPTRLLANNGEVLVQAAIDGLGLIAVPTFFTERALHTGELVEVLSDFPLRNSHIYAVCQPGRPVPAKIRAFIDFITAQLAPR